MEATQLAHVLSSSSCLLSRPALRRAALPSPRLLPRRPHRRAATASLAMPMPSPSAAAQSQAAVQQDDVLRVTTVHSPQELQEVLDQKKDKLVMLMCKAKACRPCKLFSRKYARAADLYRDSIFLEIFGDESKETRALMISMGIKVTPTFVIYRNGERVHSHGGVNERNLHKAMQSHLLESEAGYGVTLAASDDSDDE